MNVYEIKLKVYLLKDIKYENCLEAVSSYLDSGLCKNEKFLDKHNEKEYKLYNFNYLYPIETDKLYKKDKFYILTIRTIDREIADYIDSVICNHFDENIKGITSEVKIIKRKIIDKIYSITPVLIKNNDGYWKKNNDLEFFEKRIKENVLKKYKYITNKELEVCDFYNEIKFKNHKPIATNFKNIKLLGDKIELSIEDNPISQEIAYMILGVGLAENNSRGAGFMNFRWV